MTEYWIKESIKNEGFSQYYDIVYRLGMGGTCTVYSCVRKRTENKFAVKVISKKVSKKVVKTEVGILLKLNHPNIIRLYEIYESESDVHMVLEYVSGGEMFERIVSLGKYNEKQAAKCVKDILDAVSYLHDNGIIHRDLKPENLLYESDAEDSKVKLADFGIAKILEDDIHTMTVCGTPGYCAPEILLGMEYGKPVDLWSIGVIIYILLSGYEPFYHKSDKTMFLNILKSKYEFNSPHWDNVSINAKNLISKLLVKDPTKRLTAKQALTHPWVKGEAAKTNLLDQTQNNLRDFNAKRKLRASVLVTSTVGHLLKLCNLPEKTQEDIDNEVKSVVNDDADCEIQVERLNQLEMASSFVEYLNESFEDDLSKDITRGIDNSMGMDIENEDPSFGYFNVDEVDEEDVHLDVDDELMNIQEKVPLDQEIDEI